MKAKEREELLRILEARFKANGHRHRGITWPEVRAGLVANGDALTALLGMESTGGEPDVIGREGKSGPFLFCDCAEQSPAGRRSLCYDDDALATRKQHKPAGSAIGTASSMGIELLTETEYRHLQELGDFDTKTSSWIATPPEVRERGGALFCDRRYGKVFVYHNGAESYYAARGFRGIRRV